MYKPNKNSTRLVGLVFLLFVLLTSACGNDGNDTSSTEVNRTTASEAAASSVQVFRTSSVSSLEILEYRTIPESDQGPSLEEIKQGNIEYLLEAKSWQFHPEGDFVFSDKYGNQHTGWWVDQNGYIEFEGQSERIQDGSSWSSLVEGRKDGQEMIVTFKQSFSISGYPPTFSSSKYTARLELR